MQQRQTSVERDTIHYLLHAGRGGVDSQLVSGDRQVVIPMPINTFILFMAHKLCTKCE